MTIKPSKATVKNTSYAAAGAAAGTIITIALINAAFRVPKHLKVYMPKVEVK